MKKKNKDQKELTPELTSESSSKAQELKLNKFFSKVIQRGEVKATDSQIQEEWEKLYSRIKKNQEKKSDWFQWKKNVSILILFISSFVIINIPRENKSAHVIESIKKQKSSILYLDSSENRKDSDSKINYSLVQEGSRERLDEKAFFNIHHRNADTIKSFTCATKKENNICEEDYSTEFYKVIINVKGQFNTTINKLMHQNYWNKTKT